MTSIPATSRVQRLKDEAAINRIEAESLAESFNESTGLSWFWAFLFGPLYFAVHGFWARALLVLVLNLFIIGILVSPFLAYPAWRERARRKAEQVLTLDRIGRA